MASDDLRVGASSASRFYGSATATCSRTAGNGSSLYSWWAGATYSRKLVLKYQRSITSSLRPLESPLRTPRRLSSAREPRAYVPEDEATSPRAIPRTAVTRRRPSSSLDAPRRRTPTIRTPWTPGTRLCSSAAST